ncbi:unnamed protein product, partial [Prorocentrum cordatum]
MARASEFGAVDVVSVSLACVAALIRAALITLDWKTPLAELRRTADQAAPDRSLADFGRPKPWAPHWRTPAIARTLERVASKQLLPVSKDLQRAMAAAVNEVTKDPDSRKGVQKRAYAGLHRHWPEQTSDINGIDFDALIATIRTSRTRISTSSLKIWMGGWTTSARMHESVVHRCLFGCTAKDEWAHYADYLPLWSTVYSTLGAAPPAPRFECIGLHAKRPDDLHPRTCKGLDRSGPVAVTCFARARLGQSASTLAAGKPAKSPGTAAAAADKGNRESVEVLAEPPRAEAAGREAPALREGAAGRVAGWLGLGGAGEAPSTAEVEVFREGCRAVAVETLGAAAAGAVRPLFRGAVLAFNTRTLPNPGVPDGVLRSLLLPRDTLGPWLLGLEGDYAYAASLDQSFVVRLLEHGLFVLPGDSQIFACPFPVKPYVFLLDEGAARGTRSTWRSCKMLRRYGKEFELSCNRDFQGHLALCGRYHEERGGTWISDELIEVLARIHEDPGNGIRMFCFELWDKRTRELAAASFGLSIGTFFHDFSTCCLVRDRRSAGSILAKAVGALLEDCGVALWYWGCKIGYMAECTGPRRSPGPSTTAGCAPRRRRRWRRSPTPRSRPAGPPCLAGLALGRGSPRDAPRAAAPLPDVL